MGTIQYQGHILTQQGGNTYLIQGGTMDGEGTPLTHTTRASPATVIVMNIIYNKSVWCSTLPFSKQMMSFSYRQPESYKVDSFPFFFLQVVKQIFNFKMLRYVKERKKGRLRKIRFYCLCCLYKQAST